MLHSKKLSGGNKNKLLCIVLAYILYSAPAFAQNWAKVGDGFNGFVRYLYVAPSTNTLYAMGNFTESGNLSLPAFAKWNGVYWDSVAAIATLKVFEYNGELIFNRSPYLMRWNGNALDTIATFNRSISHDLTTYQGNLVAMGSFDSVNGVPANSIAKWNGVAWSAFDTTRWGSTGIVAAIEYKGELYVGGNFYTYYGGLGLNRLARWNGSQWNTVGDGIAGGIAGVGNFAVYNNDLYIGGVFYTANGNPGNCVARWDGSQWKDVSPGMPVMFAAVRDLKVYNNELYACGNFNFVGNLGIRGIAKWDGSRWCGLGSDQWNFMTMEVYNNELYVGSNFYTLNGDSVNCIAKWIGGNYTDMCTTPISNIEELNNLSSFSLSPTPATTQLTLTLNDVTPNATLQIFTIQGQQITAPQNVTQQYTQIDVSNLPAGLYFAVLQNSPLSLGEGAGVRSVRRFVKE